MLKITKLAKKLSYIKYKVKNPAMWSFLFLFENIILGSDNRNFILNVIKKKIIQTARYYLPSSYNTVGVIDDFQNWVQDDIPPEMEGSWTKCIISNKTIELKKPYTLNINYNPLYQKFGSYDTFPKAHLTFLKNARVVNKNGLIISYDNKLFTEFAKHREKGIKEAYYSRIKNYSYKRGTYATICSDYSDNYFHWMFHMLPYIKIIESKMEEIDYLIIPNDIKDIHLKTLNYLGIDQKKIIKINDGDHFLCENLYLPSPPGAGINLSWACDYLRQNFLPNKKYRPYRYVYIPRDDAYYRKVLNEEQIKNYLSKLGFEIVQMSKISLEEEIKICSEAKIIISPHGAALTSIVFSRNCKILEFFPPFRLVPVYWKIANQVGNEYYYIIGESTDAKPYQFRDFKINIKDLELTLNEMFK